MSQKKRLKPTAASAKRPAGVDSVDSAKGADPAGLATAALAAGRYKEAIEQFKDLLKRERRPAWLDGLAAGYAGRADQLAAKGMVKEALALWRTRAEACQVPLLAGPYVGWLMQGGQIEQALGLLPALDKLPPEARESARVLLAAAVLVAPDARLSGLAAEFRDQRALASAAIAACTQADTSSLDAAFQSISIRSPYRDLRPLLKALALLATDPASAAASMARVSDRGPFHGLALALRVALMPGSSWLAGLGALDDAGRALVLDLKGCPALQRPLVLDLMARAAPAAPAAAAPTPLDMLDLLLRHKRALPDTLARRQALRLLAHAPQRMGAFGAAFLPPSEAERTQVLALAAEIKNRPEDAEDHWLHLVELLSKTTPGQRRAALVLQRLADSHSPHSQGSTLCTHAQDWLAHSLRLDPNDRDTHLRLLRDARARGDLKQARSWLEAARLQFPADTGVLQEAVETALSAGAFKKAAAMAKQVLEADPLNPSVRALIGHAHVSHARKLIGTDKLPAAQRELDDAAPWLRSASERGAVTLLRGLSAEPAAAGDALLRQAVADLGGALVGGFQLLLESKRALPSKRFVPKDLLRRAGVDTGATPSAAEVLRLAQALHAVAERDAALPAALAALSAMLQRAAPLLNCSESDHLLICEALHRHKVGPLGATFAASALKRWPGKPVFVYLEAAARFGAEPWRMSQRDHERLDDVFDQAKDQGDDRTATRLGKLLDDALGPGYGPDLNSSPFDMGDMGDMDQEEALAMLGSILKSGGAEAFLDIARRELGRARFDQMRRDFKGSKQQFALSLIEIVAAAVTPAPRAPPPPIRILPPLGRPAKAAEAAKPTPATSRAKKQWDLFDD